MGNDDYEDSDYSRLYRPDPDAPITSDRHPLNMWLQGTLDDDDAEMLGWKTRRKDRDDEGEDCDPESEDEFQRDLDDT